MAGKVVPFSLRLSRESDREFLWDLHVLAMREYVEQTWGWDPEFQLRAFWESFVPGDREIIEVGGLPVGYITWQESPTEVVLVAMEIHPDRQRLGLGTEVISATLAHADRVAKPVTLRVLRVNPARRLYERLGFRLEGETATHYLMRRPVAPTA